MDPAPHESVLRTHQLVGERPHQGEDHRVGGGLHDQGLARGQGQHDARGQDNEQHGEVYKVPHFYS
jgi:hypothetical protein